MKKIDKIQADPRFILPSPGESDPVALALIVEQQSRIQKLEAVLGALECPHCGSLYKEPNEERNYPGCRVCRAVRAVLLEGK